MTQKQRQFVSEYLLDMNATQAAIRAGYSEKTARAIGCENLTKPYIAKAVKKAMDERIDRSKITADYVLQEIQAIVEAVKQDQPAVALKGLELLGKHLALFTEKQEIGGGGPIVFTVRKVGEPYESSDQ